MHRLINKNKYLVYIFFFLTLTTFNNLNISKFNFFEIKDIEIIQSKTNNIEIKKNLLENVSFAKGRNIFFINENEMKTKILNNKWVLNFSIRKKYPSKLIINFEKAEPIANIVLDNKIYLIGSNFKLLQSNKLNKKLPNIFGEPEIKNLKNFIQKINLSEIKYSNIRNFYYFKSGRWDISIDKKILIKLPQKNIIESLNLAKKIVNNKNILIKDSINLTVKNQIIIH